MSNRMECSFRPAARKSRNSRLFRNYETANADTLSNKNANPPKKLLLSHLLYIRATNSRSLSPRRSRGRSASPIRGARGGVHGSGSGSGAGGAGLSSSSPGHAFFQAQQQQQMRGCRSLSPRSFGGGGGGRVTARGFGGTGGSGKVSRLA